MVWAPAVSGCLLAARHQSVSAALVYLMAQTAAALCCRNRRRLPVTLSYIREYKSSRASWDSTQPSSPETDDHGESEQVSPRQKKRENMEAAEQIKYVDYKMTPSAFRPVLYQQNTSVLYMQTEVGPPSGGLTMFTCGNMLMNSSCIVRFSVQ